MKKKLLQLLNLPEAKLDIRKCGKDKFEIWDTIRKKYVALTPEEWVRQNVLHFLCEVKMFPKSLIQVEKNIQNIEENLRADILVYSRKGYPLLLVECKAPGTKINLKSIYQTGTYQIKSQTRYAMITNGIQHFFFEIEAQNAKLIEVIPQWSEIKNL